MNPKPQSILKLEAFYGIELDEYTDDKQLSMISGPYFKRNAIGKVIELSLVGLGISNISPLKRMTEIQHLSLSNNKISSLHFIQDATQLVYLDLSNNLIEDITMLKKFRKLSYIDVSGNQIYDLSPLYDQLSSSPAFFDASFNPVLYPSSDLDLRLPQIVVESFDALLSPAKEKIQFCKLNKRSSLDLGNCGITDLSLLPELFTCTHLERLVLSNEWAEAVDGRWQRLTSANQGIPNNLYYVPVGIKFLKNLKELICGGDWKDKDGTFKRRWRLKDFLPFSKLSKLVHLNLSNNQIGSFQTIGKLQKSQRLHLNNNLIKHIRNDIMLFDLKEVYLSNNGLSDIRFLNTFHGIETIDLHANPIRDLADIRELIRKIGISDTKWQKNTINVAKTKLSHPLPQLVAQGKYEVLAYFDRIDIERRASVPSFKNDAIKLLLVGNSNAGKSTLAHWLETGEVNLNLSTTHWMEVKRFPLELNKKTYNVAIFDFGGQEYYHDTHYLFFTDQSAYILLWDKASDEFKENPIRQRQRDGVIREVNVQGYPLPFWLDTIRFFTSRRKISTGEQEIRNILNERDERIAAITGDMTKILDAVNNTNEEVAELLQEPRNILVVQNKADRITDIGFINQAELQKGCPQIFDFGNLSLATGRRFTQFKEQLAELLETNEIVDQEFSGTWGIAKSQLEALSKAEKVEMSFLKFRNFCNEAIKNSPELAGFTQVQLKPLLFDDRDVKSFARYLNDIGLILYYPENRHLQTRVFLNLDEVLQHIYDILLKVKHDAGEFTKTHIAEALEKAQFDGACQTLVELMMQFKIIVQKPGTTDRFIAPLYLPKVPVNGVKLFLSAFQKPVYRFIFEGYIHQNVILDFFQSYAQQTMQDQGTDYFYYWREGLVLKDHATGEIVMVRFVRDGASLEKPHIDLYCMNEAKGKVLLDDIVRHIGEINDEGKITPQVTVDGVHFIPLSFIHSCEKNESWLFQYEDVNYKLADFKAYLTKEPKLKKIFISFSKEDTAYLKKMENHLSLLKRNGTVSTWTCRELQAGDDWDSRIKKEMAESDIVIFLVSDDFLASNYIWDVEIKNALERQKADQKFRIVPVIIRSCLWEDSPLSVFQNGVEYGQVIDLQDNIDAAFRRVAQSIRDLA